MNLETTCIISYENINGCILSYGHYQASGEVYQRENLGSVKHDATVFSTAFELRGVDLPFFHAWEKIFMLGKKSFFCNLR
jgi:hypothetical protein